MLGHRRFRPFWAHTPGSVGPGSEVPDVNARAQLTCHSGFDVSHVLANAWVLLFWFGSDLSVHMRRSVSL